MAKRIPAAPAGLGPRARKLWGDLQATWQFGPDEQELLRLAVEAADRAHKAQTILDAEGLVVRDRFGQPKEHPAVAVRTAAEAATARLLRQLGLDDGAERSNRNTAIRLGVVRDYQKRRQA